jgi:DNA ligase (NAD+)
MGALEGADEPATQADLLGYLRVWGFPVSPLVTRVETIEEAQAYADQRAAARFDLGYDIDGAVIKIDDRWQQQELGSVGRDPRWAIAYKFAPAEGNTKLLGINVSVGRTGALTPIASLAPLKLGGVTITSAQLFNEDEVRRKDLRIGDTVVVQRHGDVIPGIVKAMVELRDGTEQPWTFPTNCPVCDTPVVRAEGGAVTYCPNLQCPARHLENVIHFAAVMDIRGLGEAIAERLVGSALIHDVADLYHLTKEQLLTLPGFQEKSAENLLRSIETSKRQPFERVLCAIGIRMVGEKAAESLAQGFHSADALLNSTEAEISALPGVGPKIAHSVYEWLQVDTHRQFIEKLKAAGLRMEVTDDGSAATDGLPFSGQTFLLTGSLSQLTRGQAEQAIKSLGGKIAPSVTKSLDHLVVGDAPGSKVAKAEKLGVPTRTEDWLVEQLREHGAMPEKRERLS